jgi:SSS family solute:Na+ symporter
MQTLDWIVIAVYGLGMLAVGLYFSRKTKTSEDYMLGGRKMKSWAVGLSFFATLFSSISYLATPGEVIKYGPIIFSGIAMFPLVYLLVGWFLIPKIMKVKVTSAYELLETRLGPSVRILASFLFIFMRIIWMSVMIYMCSVKVITPVMGWSQDAALWVGIIMGVVTVAYTTVGGLQAVVLTDVVQTFILFGAAFVSIGLIAKSLGSINAIFPHHYPSSWLEWKFFGTGSRVSILTAFVSMLTWFVFTAGSDQMAIQRYLSTRDVKTARGVLLVSLIADTLVSLLLIGLGLGLLAYFQANPELVPEGGSIADCADRLFPHFIVIGLPAGFTGLVIAGLLAAAMSSLSAGVNSSCLSISRDFVARFRKNELSESAQIKLDKGISVGIGIVIVLLSLVMGKIRGNLLELTYKTCNLLTAPLFVPFFMALFVRRATEFGTFAGTIASVIAAVLIGFSAEFFGKGISFVWIMPGSFVAGVLVGMIFSFLWPNKNKPLEDR